MTDIMQKVAEVAPKHYAFLLKTASEVKESPYKEEITTELDRLVKLAMNFAGMGGAAKAGLGAMGRGAGQLGMAVGGAAVGGIALALAGDMYAAAKRGITKTRNYKNMLDANPDLKQLPAKNVQNAFSVLHRLNPEFSGDPHIAGAWVKKQSLYSEDGFGDVTMLKGLVDTHKNMQDSNKLMSFPKMEGGRGGFGHKEKKQLGDLNAGVVDLDDRLGRQGF